MNNKKADILLYGILLGSTTLFSMNFPHKRPMNTIKTIHAVPQYYSDLATELSQQIKFTGRGSPHKESKILLVNVWHDCKISEILNCNAREITSDITEIITAFGHDDNQRYVNWKAAPFNTIGVGIESEIYPTYVTCHPETRKDAYKEIIKILKKGWYFTSPQDNLTMDHTQPEETWLLIMKKQNLLYESELIHYLISKFKVNDIIKCNTNSLQYIDDYEVQKTNYIYLWVKDNAMDAFDTIFNFEVHEHAPLDTQDIQERFDPSSMQLIEEVPDLSAPVHLTIAFIVVCLFLYECYMIT